MPYGIWLHMPYEAWKLFDKRLDYRGGVIEMVIWQLPEADADRPQGLKYRLAYVRQGRRLVGYDNERGKGDHKHIGDRQLPYVFVSVDQLVRDFMADVNHYAGEM